METKENSGFSSSTSDSMAAHFSELRELTQKIEAVCEGRPINEVLAALSHVLVFGMIENIDDPSVYKATYGRIKEILKKGYKACKLKKNLE